MNRIIKPALILLLGLTFVACDSAAVQCDENDLSCNPKDEPPPQDPPPKEEPGIAVYSVNLKDGSRRVESAPFDAVDLATIISPAVGWFENPRLSNSGQLVLYLGVEGVQHAGEPYLTDLETGDTQPLRMFQVDQTNPIFPDMETVVWEASDTGFFYSQRSGISGSPSLWHYSLLDYSKTLLRDTESTSYTLIGTDTLVAKLYDSPVTYTGFDLLNLSGQEIGTIEIDSLSVMFGDEPGGAVTIPSWNPIRRLLTFELWFRNQEGILIAICDKEGENFRIISNHGGTYLDTRPRWGPNGIIIFERAVPSNDWTTTATLMSFDIDTNKLSVYLASQSIAGAKGIQHFDTVR